MSTSRPQPSVDAPQPIGPGRLVLVVGPSGAGKDTLIAGAKAACSADPCVVFPRRVVTRRPSAAEEHDSLTDAAFDRAARRGEFALWWVAHGFKYGIPRGVDDSMRAGHTLVCNVSRGIVSEARARYIHVAVALITAPADILIKRLVGRSRASDGSHSQRITRNNAFAEFRADHEIENTGALEPAVQMLLDVIYETIARPTA